MSDKKLARRTRVKVWFDNVDISADVSKYLQSFTYTDNEGIEIDDLQLKLDDAGDVWLTKWLNSAVEGALKGSVEGSSSSGSGYTVTAESGLNVRNGAGTSYSVMGVLPYGAAIEVFETTNGWAKISYSGQDAYVHSDYISSSGSVTKQDTSTPGTVKGLRIRASIIPENWNNNREDTALDTGEFELDSVDASGPPSCITIKGTALPYDSAIRQKKSRAWESYTLSGIANEIAATNNMACIFDSSKNPNYDRTEQSNTSDMEFLQNLCVNAGISLKVTSNILVLYREVDYEDKPALKTIERGKNRGYTKYKLRTGENDTNYEACHVRYMNPLTGQLIEYTHTLEDAGENPRVLEIRAKVSSVVEAKELAINRLRQKNKFEHEAEFTLPGDPDYVAGIAVALKGWGMFDGKYIVRQAKHSVSNSGYSVTVSLRKTLGY